MPANRSSHRDDPVATYPTASAAGPATAELQQIQAALGVGTAADVVNMVRNLENQLADLYAEREEAPSGDPTAHANLQHEVTVLRAMRQTLADEGGCTSADEAVARLHNLEDQLKDLYAEREEVSRVLGSGDPEHLRTMIANLENQLKDLYGERDELGATLGGSDAPYLQSVVQGLHAQVEDLYRDRDLLRQETGATDAEALLGMIRNMEDQLKDVYAERERGDGDGIDGAIAALQRFKVHFQAEDDARQHLLRDANANSLAEVRQRIGDHRRQLDGLITAVGRLSR